MIERVHVDRRRLAKQIERRITEPVPVVDEPTAEGEAKQRIRTSLSDRSRHGLEQRPCLGISPHENLPTPLHPETGVDETAVAYRSIRGSDTARDRSPRSHAAAASAARW